MFKVPLLPTIFVHFLGTNDSNVIIQCNAPEYYNNVKQSFKGEKAVEAC